MTIQLDSQGDPGTEADVEVEEIYFLKRRIDDAEAAASSHMAPDNTGCPGSELPKVNNPLLDGEQPDDYRSVSKSLCEVSTKPQPTGFKATIDLSSSPQETKSCTATVHGLSDGLKDDPTDTPEESKIAEDSITRKNANASDIGPTKVPAPSERKNAPADTTYHKPLDNSVEPAKSFVVGPAPSKIMSHIHDGTIIIAQDIELARDPQAGEKDNMYPTDKGIISFKERPMTVLKVLNSFKDRRGVRNVTKVRCFRHWTHQEKGLRILDDTLRDDRDYYFRLLKRGEKMDPGDSPHEPIQVERYKGRLSKHSYLQVRDVVDIDITGLVSIKGQISSGDWLRIYEFHLSLDSQYLQSVLSEQVSLQSMIGNFPIIRRLTDSEDHQSQKEQSSRKSPVNIYGDVYSGNARFERQKNKENHGTQYNGPVTNTGNRAHPTHLHRQDTLSTDARRLSTHSKNEFTGQLRQDTGDDASGNAMLYSEEWPGLSESLEWANVLRSQPQHDLRQERETSYPYGSRSRSRSPTREREGEFYGYYRGGSPRAQHENATYDGQYDRRETSHSNHGRVDTGFHYGQGHVEIDHPSDIHASGNHRDQHVQGAQGRNFSGGEPRHSTGTHMNSNVQDQPINEEFWPRRRRHETNYDDND